MLTVQEIEQLLAISRSVLTRAEDELQVATREFISRVEEVTATKARIQRLERYRERAAQEGGGHAEPAPT